MAGIVLVGVGRVRVGKRDAAVVACVVDRVVVVMRSFAARFGEVVGG